LFPALAESLPAELRARSAVLDGEIVCLDRHGKTQCSGVANPGYMPSICSGAKARTCGICR